MLSVTEWKQNKTTTTPVQNTGFQSVSDWKSSSSNKIRTLTREAELAKVEADKGFGFMDIIKGIPKAVYDVYSPIVKRMVPVYTEPTKVAIERGKEFVSSLTSADKTAETVAKGLEAGVSAVSTVFTPISAVFEEADKVPVFREAAQLLSMPFEAGAITGSFFADRFVDVLPVSKENKDILRPAMEEVGSTVGMIWIGGKVMKTLTKGEPLTKEKIAEFKKEGESVPKTIKVIEKQQAEVKPVETAKPLSVKEWQEKGKPTVEKAEKPTTTLQQEAKKFIDEGKSADEFIEAQPKVYHGSLEGRVTKLEDKPFFVSPDKNMARSYGKEISNFYLKDGKKADLQDVELLKKVVGIENYNKGESIFKKLNIQTQEKVLKNNLSGLKRDFLSKSDESLLSDYLFVEKPTNTAVVFRQKQIQDKLKKLGFDYYENRTGYGDTDFGASYMGSQKPEIIVLNKDILKTKSQLKDIYNKAKEIPVEPKGKVSGVAKSIEAKAIEQGLIEKGFDKLAEYDPVTIKEQSKLVSDIMSKDIEMAKRIALGQEPLPKGVKGASIFQAMEDYAMKTKDGKLALDIANSPIATEISTAGQTLRLSAERTQDTATAKIREIKKEREKAVEKKLKGKKPKKVKDSINKSLKEKSKKAKPNKYDLANLLDKIVC